MSERFLEMATIQSPCLEKVLLDVTNRESLGKRECELKLEVFVEFQLMILKSVASRQKVESMVFINSYSKVN